MFSRGGIDLPIRRKRLVAIILLAILLLSGVGTIAVAQELNISAQAAVLMEASSGDVIYEKNMHTPLPMASITKIMTLVLALEAVQAGNVRLDDTVTTSEYANKMGGSQITPIAT
jgi:D-alanyl-D-alanine carboxypeptidase (penicillin-binding protein 5/6)